MNKEKLMDLGIAVPTGFSAGYAREVVNPLPGTGMGGFGNSSTRLSQEVADDLMVTVTALSDGESIFILTTHDTIYASSAMIKRATLLLSEKYGIPEANVILNATHTHSGPCLHTPKAPGCQDYSDRFWAAFERVADEAIRDLSPARAFWGETHTPNLNYVRRYVSKHDGSFLGNWPTLQDPRDARHETEPDNQLQILWLKREGKKDILLCNWQCHPCSWKLGEADGTTVSPDFISSCRAYVEEKFDVLFAYHQGACGNLASGTKILGEKYNVRYRVMGKELALSVRDAMENAVPLQTGTFRAVRNHHLATTCEAYREKAKVGETETLFLNTLSIGDLSIATIPCEWFDVCGMTVKQASPFAHTFICGYTNGVYGYLPADYAWDAGGYEVKKCHFVRGTGEEVCDHLLAMLNEIK